MRWIGLKRPLLAFCGPSSPSGMASDRTSPVRTRRAAAMRCSARRWLSVPSSSSGPHRPQLQNFAASSRTVSMLGPALTRSPAATDAERCRGGPGRPAVVDLACDGAFDLGDDQHPLGNLVGGEPVPAVRTQVRLGRCSTRRGGDQRDHQLAPELVRDADHRGVGQVGMLPQDLLDLLREDLLPAGVDALRAAADQAQRPVGRKLGEVPGQRVSAPPPSRRKVAADLASSPR